VLRSARLAAELEQRLEQLRASRRRLVTAQDAERRRLERDLHDGAQHDLVALRMKLGLAEGEAAASGSRLAVLLAEVREETAAALENIRQLSRGLYPPLLESQGLGAALTAHARRLPIQVEVRAGGERFTREIETAVYFCCVEALQNAAKHAEAQRAWIVIESCPAQLRFEVGDDGHGFDAGAGRQGGGLQNITDRIEALGGTIRIVSGSGGTRIEGLLEAEPLRSPHESTGAG
jgi:signal transduction histidine kinase